MIKVSLKKGFLSSVDDGICIMHNSVFKRESEEHFILVAG
jgi:hypothetical protein